MNSFNIEIVTPEGAVYSGQCQSIILRTPEGDVEILSGHTDYLAALDTGEVRIKTEEGVRYASASGGFVSVCKGDVRVIATTFEFADQINEERARRAKEVAEARLRDAKTDMEIRRATAKLKRAASRIKVSELK